MLDNLDAFQTLGLDIEGLLIKGAQLSYTKGQPKLKQIFEIAITPPTEGDHVNPLYIEKSGTPVSDLIQKNMVVTSLGTNKVLTRQLEIKLKKEKDIDAVLAFQTEPLLPYPIENALLDRIIVSQTQDGTNLTILAARKDHISQHLELWGGYQIDPEIISCVPTSLASFISFFYPAETSLLVLYIGMTYSTCLLIKEGKLIASHAINEGISHLQHAYDHDRQNNESGLSEKFEEFNFSELNQVQTPLLAQAFENLRLEINRTMLSLSKGTKEKLIEKVALLGNVADFPILYSQIQKSLNKSYVDPIGNSLFPLSTEELKKFSIPIGSALSALPQKNDHINFRKDEFAYPNPWKHFKKPLAIYMLVCLFLAFSFYLFGEMYLENQVNNEKEEYVNLLVLMNKPYRAFEEEYRTKFPSQNTFVDPNNFDLKNLTQEELLNRIRYLEKELQATPDSFALHPNVPRVSDVLAWLNTHPVLTAKDPNELLPPIQLDNFSYIMVKRPEQTKKQEKYQVKVEMEFTSPTPKQAREFHDALIAPNDFVDPKGEVKWSSNRGKYRTSFILKDKTIYPTN